MKPRFTKTRLAIASLAVMIMGTALVPLLFVPHHAEAAWWTSTWNYRRQITFNNSASTENLVNFPVRVSLTAANIDYSKTKAGGADIRFVDSDNTTALSYEIESWNAAGTSEVWVKVPQIDLGSSTDFIYMYYGNPSATDAQSPTGVWDTNFKMVNHLKEPGTCPGTTFVDSTSLNNSVCGTGTTTTASGQISSARTFASASSEYINSSAVVSSIATGNVTFSFWFKPTTTYNSTTAATTLMSIADPGSSNDFRVWLDTKGKLNASDLANNALSTQTTWTAGTWYCVTATIDLVAPAIKLYVNGALAGSTAAASRSTPNATTAQLGRWDSGTPEFYNGALDEVRISSSARSLSWENTDYLSQNNTLNTFAGEENDLPDAPTLIAPTTSSIPVLPQFQLRATNQQNPTSLKYKIDVCTVSDCSSILRTMNEVTDQTGWSGQDAGAGTAYVTSTTIGSATIATHTYQGPPLTPNTPYWWRAYAIDTGGGNAFGPASSIQSFTTSQVPAAPTLVNPLTTGASQVPQFQLRTTDADSDYLRYKIDICTTSNCSAIDRTVDQTGSQVGWLNQDTQGGTAFLGSSVITSSSMGNYQLQTPFLLPSTQYWWRAYAIDPGGSNTWSAASGISTFSTATVQVRINGGTTIMGGTKIGQ